MPDILGAKPLVKILVSEIVSSKGLKSMSDSQTAGAAFVGDGHQFALGQLLICEH